MSEYISIVWHVRKFKRVRPALYAQIAVHSVATSIYLGVSFLLQHGHNRVFIAWYIVCAAETHLMSRMSLLTIIILGDGIVVLADKVKVVVQRSTNSIPHLAMVLFMQGFTQFVVWSEIVNVLNHIHTDWMTAAFSAGTSAAHPSLIETVNAALDNITAVPDSSWPQMARYFTTFADVHLPADNTTELVFDIFSALLATMHNSLFATFDVHLKQESIEEGRYRDVTFGTLGGGFETTINMDAWDRLRLVFVYGYVASGACLASMTLLTIVSRMTPWTPWPVVRATVYLLLALGLALLTAVRVDEDATDGFLFSPWLLPTICLVWLVVLLLTHSHSVPPLFFKRRPILAIRRRKECDDADF
ncbi:uncharacterized protein MAM_06373 [Metarhizium album ARSEF 1941]|uniref:Transmembrane protein n=1 Tax=Metarhizium album (strain ARSEF 1941) TaxID=1081103 RepID=A0A0B2WIC2_METAS|nr:uncharacterized protein MAM_06373 [Metarhizium album ARSEF 1941]KHN95761.1 hypothetical protein MAM_06373 [Metarhizium album ARSEF 1941]